MQTEDRLIDVEEAAKILCTSPDYLYRAWRKLPYAVKLSRKQLRFSEQGIYKYIAEQQNGGSALVENGEKK